MKRNVKNVKNVKKSTKGRKRRVVRRPTQRQSQSQKVIIGARQLEPQPAVYQPPIIINQGAPSMRYDTQDLINEQRQQNALLAQKIEHFKETTANAMEKIRSVPDVEASAMMEPREVPTGNLIDTSEDLMSFEDVNPYSPFGDLIDLSSPAAIFIPPPQEQVEEKIPTIKPSKILNLHQDEEKKPSFFDKIHSTVEQKEEKNIPVPEGLKLEKEKTRKYTEPPKYVELKSPDIKPVLLEKSKEEEKPVESKISAMDVLKQMEAQKKEEKSKTWANIVKKGGEEPKEVKEVKEDKGYKPPQQSGETSYEKDIVSKTPSFPNATTEDLNKLTMTQIKQWIKQEGIKVKTSGKKADVIRSIQNLSSQQTMHSFF